MSFTSLASNFLILSYLPNLIPHFLHFIHPYLYKPQQIPYPGQHKYYRNYSISFFALTLCYIIYNLYKVYDSLDYNHYEILGLNRREFSQKILKKSWNEFSLYYHPDKNPNNELIYLKLSKSYEILKNPAKKYIYDVIGDSVLNCKDCKVAQNFINSHLRDIFIFYSSTIFFIGAYILLGFQSNFYWKFLILAFLFYLELSVLVGKVNFSLLSTLFPSKTPYEFSLYFRQLAFDLVYLTTHICNLLLPNQEHQQSLAIQKCNKLINNIGIRSSRTFEGQVIQHPKSGQQKLFDQLKKWQEIELMATDREFQNAIANYDVAKSI